MSGIADKPLALDMIQGNIIGFNKPWQHFFFLNFDNADMSKVHEWLGTLAPNVTSGHDVLDFRKRLRAHQQALNEARNTGDPPLETWRNLAFTHAGLKLLVKPDQLEGFPAEFVAGMAERAGILGDLGTGAPSKWAFARVQEPSKPGDAETGQATDAVKKALRPVHALLLLAADSDSKLIDEVEKQEDARRGTGIEVVFDERGGDFAAARGKEHFGFSDGVSQPGFRGEDFNHPHQDPIWPGEFVLGYPRQNPNPKEGEEDAPLAAGQPTPDWIADGSYLVIRRLQQNVDAFNAFVGDEAVRLGLSEELVRAKLVGRYRSGAPLAALTPEELARAERAAPGDGADPGEVDKGLVAGSRAQKFGYEKDPAGDRVPRGAHIRRLNPRGQGDPKHSLIQTKRILRRGIAFNNSPDDRGLLFVCYQSSIANQFEFLQQSWANDPYFPPSPAGEDFTIPGRDPFIGQGPADRTFHIPGTTTERARLQQWVTMTGGGYFFSPSKEALSRLADLEPPERPQVQSVDQPGQPIAPQVDPPITGAGDCRLQITVSFNDLKPTLYYPWRVWIQGMSVWESQTNDYLAPNKDGFATGTMTVRLLKVLEALDPDLTVGAIVEALRRVEVGETPRAVLGAYGVWQVELITQQDPERKTIGAIPRSEAIQPMAFPQAQPVWVAERVGELFPIDMSIWPG